MTALATPPKLQFLDSNGAPLVGGKLYTYAAGTTTPLASYTDSSGNTANTNPIILDSRGEASVWLGTTLYKMALYDSTNVLIWTVDNIGGFATLAQLAASGGSNLIGFLQAGTGAVATTVQAELRRKTYVENFSSVQAAINATPPGGALEFGAGITYTLTAPLTGVSNIELIGNGCTITATTRIQSYFSFTGCSNFQIYGFNFNLAKTSLVTYAVGDYPNIYNCGIYMSSCSDIEIYQNTFTNLYTRSIYSNNGSGRLDIHDNDFSSPLQTQMYMLEHIAVGQNSGDIHVNKNRILNAAYTSPSVGICGVTMSGISGSADVSNNTFDYCGRDNTGAHRLGVIDFYADQKNVTIKDNVVTNMMAMFSRISSTNHAEVSGNIVSTNANVEVASTILSIEGIADYYGVPAVVPGVTDINVHHNVFNGSAANTYGIGVTAYDFAYPSTNIRIHHNTFRDVDLAVSTGGPFDNISIDDNAIYGVGGGSIQVLYTGGGIVLTALHGVNQANSIYRNLRISNNRQMLASPGSKRAITVTFSTSPAYTGIIREIRIVGNYAFANTAGTSFASLLEANSTLSLESFIVQDNTIQNWATGFYVRDMGELLFTGNKAKDVTTLFSDGGGITNYKYENNRYSNTGMQWGSQQLGGGGTMTVSTAEVRTGDKINLQVKILAGTPGFLSVGTITSGTSFVVNSSNAADSSTVYWEIEH
jgi:hypothetical protein